MDRLSTSKEHVVPQGLGNDNLILPPVVICDDCNHRRAGRLDQALQEFEFVKLAKAAAGIPSKSGRRPVATFRGLEISCRGASNIHFKFDDTATVVEGRNGIKFSLPKIPEPVPKAIRLVVRALLKIALGIVYLEEGAEVALSARYDPVRNAVLGRGGEYHGALLLGAQAHRHVTESKGGSLQRFPYEMDGRPLTLFGIDILGVNMLTEMELGAEFIPLARQLVEAAQEFWGMERWLSFEC